MYIFGVELNLLRPDKTNFINVKYSFELFENGTKINAVAAWTHVNIVFVKKISLNIVPHFAVV
jgi:hypothetical protein